MNTSIPTKSAVAGKSNNNTSRMTAEQLRELLMSQPDLVAEFRTIENEKVADLEAQLDAKFAECKVLLDEIETIKEDFTPPWTRVPQQCAMDIKEFITKQGGSAIKADIVTAMEAQHTSGKVEKTLINRCAGERPLWTYANETDTYTVIKTKKSNN